MKAKVIHYPNGYGFGHDWQLQLTNDQGEMKQLYLGQDAKVCRRIIGCMEDEIQGLIGGNNIDNPEINENLAWLIIDSVNADPANQDREVVFNALMNVQPWEIAAE